VRQGGPLLLAAALAAVVGCGAEPPPAPADRSTSLVVHCAFAEADVGPLLAAFEAASGVELEVRYGSSAELAEALVMGRAEGPALFLATDGAALGAVAAAGLASPLPAEVLAGLDPLFTDSERRWAGLLGRARTVVYDPQRTPSEEVPGDLVALGDERFRGRVGLAPGTRSFRVHLAAYRALHGAPVAARLLERLAANEARVYPDGEGVVAAVLDGEIDFGLADHSDLWRVRAERGVVAGASLPLPAADASGFLDLSGAAVLGPGQAASGAPAVEMVRFLLTPESQALLAGRTFDYPLTPGVPPAVDLVPLAEMDPADVDYGAVAEALPEAVEILAASGLGG
jgi:iron(III) transport system substrate-binding protein